VTTLRVGTRGSTLALWQARWVAASLEHAGGIRCDLVILKTTADRFPETPLPALGGKRLFVKELEEALLAGTIDLAVHSAKDLPAWLPEGLTLAAVPPRENPFDVLVASRDAPRASNLDTLVAALGPRPRLGTSSIRRTAQLRRLFPQATFTPVRGNLETRLRKLDEGACDALVLAAAGLNRLGLAQRIGAVLPLDVCVPAPGQGALAVEVRADDATTRALVAPLGDPSTATAVAAERALVGALGGGCQVPLGALATVEGARLTLYAVVVSPDGARLIRHVATGSASAPEEVAAEAARALLDAGAADILRGLGESSVERPA
jgi:hydroxymethylbilane synthase